MKIKGMVDEDFVNYKKPSMFISFPSCTFKCEAECGVRCCQNSALAQAPDIDIHIGDLVDRYLNNPITSAIVCGGLEPFDSWNDLYELILFLRSQGCLCDVVIYTGYNENEIPNEYIKRLSELHNIIIKFGRFIPNQESHYDDTLGIVLSSQNQYARRIS